MDECAIRPPSIDRNRANGSLATSLRPMVPWRGDSAVALILHLDMLLRRVAGAWTAGSHRRIRSWARQRCL
jgi:hypothetical protein